MRTFRSFAVIPAAGRSTRMGANKLLLPVGNRTLIDCAIDAYTNGQIDEVVIVAPAVDEQLLERCRQHPVHTVATRTRPTEMRRTIEVGVEYVADRFTPESDDALLVGPADLPETTPVVVDKLLSMHASGSRSPLVPRFSGKGGHPVLLPWGLVDGLFSLPAGRGLNALIKQNSATYIDCDSPGIRTDIDTPDDYERFLRRRGI